jgi:hypothetical protein
VAFSERANNALLNLLLQHCGVRAKKADRDAALAADRAQAARRHRTCTFLDLGGGFGTIDCN